MNHTPCPRCGGYHTVPLSGYAHHCSSCMSNFGFSDAKKANAAADAVEQLHFFIGGHCGASFRLLLTAAGQHEAESWNAPACTPMPDYTYSPTRFRRLVRRLIRHYFVLDWNPDYTHTDILDGTQWELVFILHNRQELRYSGSNAYPPRFRQLLRLLAPYFQAQGIRFP